MIQVNDVLGQHEMRAKLSENLQNLKYNDHFVPGSAQTTT